MDIKKLFRDSYDSLSGMWGIAIGGVLIYTLISVVLNFIAGIIAGIIAVNVTPDTLSEAEAEILSQGISTLTSLPISIFIAPPLVVGLLIFSLNVSRNSEPEISDLFLGFKKQWGKYILANLLLGFLLSVGFILLIIPGIIAALMFSQVFYILAEDDDIGVVEAFQKSTSMMKGNKTSLFLVYLINFGISLLGLLTCCIGFIWIIPYTSVVLAKFYDEVSNK
ncbi:DUF975 family protein [Flavobacteriaceae bacterium]|nr:DUF975 family protein [Flavobacteriaceae bacterium]MDC1492306.1 DUF975 family protein [Flavobacteriaceae bacterium]